MVYEGFANFEVMIASLVLRLEYDLVTVGLTDEPVSSAEGFLIQPHMALNEVELDDVDVLIIPGGDYEPLYENEAFYELLKGVHAKKAIIGATSTAPYHLVKAGVLEGLEYTTDLDVKAMPEFNANLYVNQNVVKEANVITAKANGYVDFAIEMGKVLEVFESDEEIEETIAFFKDIKKK